MCCWALLGAFGVLDGGLWGPIGHPWRAQKGAQGALVEPWGVLAVPWPPLGGGKGVAKIEKVWFSCNSRLKQGLKVIDGTAILASFWGGGAAQWIQDP